MLSSIVTDGLDDLLIQYFKLQFNISVADIVRSSVCQPAHIRCSDDGTTAASAHFSLHSYIHCSSSSPTQLFSAPRIAKHVGDIKRSSGENSRCARTGADGGVCAVRRLRAAGANRRAALLAPGMTALRVSPIHIQSIHESHLWQIFWRRRNAAPCTGRTSPWLQDSTECEMLHESSVLIAVVWRGACADG